jgi:hypothetical protein
MSNDTEDTTTYHVVVNGEEQYSIWPAYKPLPAGWREAGVILAPGQSVRLSQDNSLVLSQPPVPVGDPVDGVLVQRDGQPAIDKTFSILGTARAAGVAIRRTGVGQALSVSARDAAGGVLQLQPVDRLGPPQQLLTLVFDQPQAEQLFLAPANELVFSVVAFPALPERGFSGPAFLVQAFAAGQQAPSVNQFIEGSADLAIRSLATLAVRGLAVDCVSLWISSSLGMIWTSP